jgi:HlyD family secretion protein
MKWAAVILAVVVVVVGGVWYFRHGRVDAPAYQTSAVTRGELLQMVTATGALNPVTNVTVGCQVSGRISKLYVDYNSAVSNGQLIAEIDPRTYDAQVAQARADLANANANLELQRVEAERAMELFTNKLVSQSDHDTAIATLHEADAMVQIKEASLSNAVANLGYCKIYSPVDGVVISRAVDVGQTVAASLSAPTLFQIANDLTKMQIDASVAEADIGGVKEGQEVNFTVDAYPYQTFHGTVTQVRNAPTTVNNVVTYDCVIGVSNPDYKLKPGMTANVSIIIAQREDALKIPNAALRFRPPDNAVIQTNVPAPALATASTTNAGGRLAEGGRGRRGGGGNGARRPGERPLFHIVYVQAGDAADKDDKILATPIKTGISDGINTEVVDGLKEGDQVVTGTVLSGAQAQPQAANPFTGRPRFR